jgi:hypothetical protein
MNIVAACIVRATELFLHPGYTSAWVPPRYPRSRPVVEAITPPPPSRVVEAALGDTGGSVVSDGVIGTLAGTGDAAAAPAAGQGFYLDLFAGPDRWTALIVAAVTVAVALVLIVVMRGRRLKVQGDAIDDFIPDLDGPGELDAQPSG